MKSTVPEVAWRHDVQDLEAWKAARTGYPIIDAAMRELSQTGQMLTAVSRFLGFDQIEGQLEVYTSTRSIWGTAL